MAYIKRDSNYGGSLADKKGWEDIYQEFGIIQHNIMPCVKNLTDFLLHKKKETLILLDAGCGTGRHTVFMAKSLASRKNIYIEAFDISGEAIKILNKIIQESKILKNNNVSIHTFINDLDEGLSNYKDGYFDGIVSTLVVEHGLIEQIKKWTKNMKRVLKKGGLFAFSVLSINDPRYKTGEKIESGTKINTKQKDGYLPHHFFTDEEIENLFTEFEIVYKNLESRDGVTANVKAKHWEYIFKKI